MSRFDVIAFDADDTLWENERLYRNVQGQFVQLLAHYHEPEWIQERLYQTEMRNIQHFGYGIKAFALSLIETAVELTEGRISGHDVLTVINLAKEMLQTRLPLLKGVAETVPQLAEQYRLMIITKGDLLDQEIKIGRSGLETYFQQVEVVSQKSRETYERVLRRHDLEPGRFLMVGNSLRSDIWPVLELGGHAVFVPHELTWVHEVIDPPPTDQPGYYRLDDVGELPALLNRLEGFAG